MQENEKNKNLDLYFFNEIISKNTKNKKETKAEKKERIRLRMLIILDSIQKNFKPPNIFFFYGYVCGTGEQ